MPTCASPGCVTPVDPKANHPCGGLSGRGDPGCGEYFCDPHVLDHPCPNPYGTCPVCDQPIPRVTDPSLIHYDTHRSSRNAYRFFHNRCKPDEGR